MLRNLFQKILHIIEWLQIISFYVFYDAVDDVRGFCTTDGINYLPIFLSYSSEHNKKIGYLFHDSVKGAQASAAFTVYLKQQSSTILRPYYYFKHLITELSKLCEEKGNMDSTKMDHLLPGATELSKECRKPRC